MNARTLTFAQGAAWATMSTVSATLGWRGGLVIIWIVSMVLDYVTGTVAALKAGEWSSAKAREGLFHKGGMFAIVCAATLLDFLLKIMQHSGAVDLPFVYDATLMPITMAWFSVTEIGSSIENAAKQGVEIPPWFRAKIRRFLSVINGSQNVEDENEKQDEKPDEK